MQKFGITQPDYDVYVTDSYVRPIPPKPPEPVVYCPKQKRSYPVSQYPGAAICKYEACPGIYFDTLAEAEAYKEIHCPEIPSHPPGPDIMKAILPIGIGAGALLLIYFLFFRKGQ